MQTQSTPSSVVSDNGVSRVWREGGFVYKRQPKYLTDNEIYALQVLFPTGYVPWAERTSIDTIKMEDLGNPEPVTDKTAFMAHLPLVLDALKSCSLRHGDLTVYAVIVKENRPIIIDWAESRTWYDPRPDKRREGDRYWLTRTMEELCP